jgi:outer membrane protein TolC
MQTKKWSTGQISTLDLETAQQDVSAQNSAVQQAEINLFTSVEQYRWALNGTIIQPEN